MKLPITITAPEATAVNGKVVTAEIDEPLASRITNNTSGLSTIAKIIEDKVVIMYVDTKLKVRGGSIADLVGTSVPTSLGAFCTVVEENIKMKDCDKVNMAMLRTYCKESGYPGCYKLRRNEMVKLLC